jgi:hypothetical protein
MTDFDVGFLIGMLVGGICVLIAQAIGVLT